MVSEYTIKVTTYDDDMQNLGYRYDWVVFENGEELAINWEGSYKDKYRAVRDATKALLSVIKMESR